MSSFRDAKDRLPRGVTALPTTRGGRGFRASIKRGKGDMVHLGLYETPWLAAFAFDIACRALGRGDGSTLEIPLKEQPTADQVRAIHAKVNRRLGFEREEPDPLEFPPGKSDLFPVFEIAVVGYWRNKVAENKRSHPETAINSAADALASAARVLFSTNLFDDEAPREVLRGFTARRIDAAFHMQRLTREILDDDGDDLELLARWLAYPDIFLGGRGRGFVEEIHELYSDIFADMAAGKNADTLPEWAIVLEIVPPFRLDLVREAYRARSLVVHPDVGGSNAEFVKLRSAYETAVAYCKSRGR